jgi:hypothetical protein
MKLLTFDGFEFDLVLSATAFVLLPQSIIKISQNFTRRTVGPFLAWNRRSVQFKA